MKVLIVDDDPFIVDMYTLKLREAGFDVAHAADGKKGLQEIKAGGHDIILLDVVLPLMDGFEILSVLQREGAPHAPIVLLTNLGQREDVERGLALGAVDYVIKAHFTPREVLEKVQGVVGKKP
jgi:DNA-binding response OmpR family regulator